MYVDDCLCMAEDWNEHVDQLEKVLEVFQKGNMTVNFDKSMFCRPRMDYLGFVISTEEIRLLEKKK